MLKAKITAALSNGYNYSGSKELVGAYSVMGKIDGQIKEVVSARAYMGKSKQASTVYASIWVHTGTVHTSGRGSAGGYGYHKESTAFQDAISSAGIELYGTVGAVSSWNYDEKRAYTPAELSKMKREITKKRMRIGGVGESAMRDAFEAIARAAGAKGKLIYVSHS
jgi:hypothetical protein